MWMKHQMTDIGLIILKDILDHTLTQGAMLSFLLQLFFFQITNTLRDYDKNSCRSSGNIAPRRRPSLGSKGLIRLFIILEKGSVLIILPAKKNNLASDQKQTQTLYQTYGFPIFFCKFYFFFTFFESVHITIKSNL